MLFYLSFITIFFFPGKWDLVEKVSVAQFYAQSSQWGFTVLSIWDEDYTYRRKCFYMIQEYFILFFFSGNKFSFTQFYGLLLNLWKHFFCYSLPLFSAIIYLGKTLFFSWAAAETICMSCERGDWEALCRYLYAFVSSVWHPSVF